MLDAFNTKNTSHYQLHTDLVDKPGGVRGCHNCHVRFCGEQTKDHLKQLYSEWLFGGDNTSVPTVRTKENNVTLLCQQMITSRQRISPKVTVKGFRMC
jgi:hypothetical protein